MCSSDLEFKTPLASLYDRVIQAIREVVVHAHVDEIRKQGEGIARFALQRLQGMQLPKVLGIEIFNVLVTSIKATDAGNDALAAQQMGEFTKVRDWQLDAMMISQSKMTPEWLMVHRPEIYAQIMAGNQALLKEMIDKGLLDPAGFLNQTTGAQPFDPLRLTGGLGFPGLGAPVSSQPAPPQLTGQTVSGQTPAADIHARMREELSLLEKLPGAQVQAKPGTDTSGIPDGSYDVRVQLPRTSGGLITLYLACPAGYPQKPPDLDVDVEGQATPFQSATLRRWAGQYLVEIAREVKQYFG